ncbi:hypothetical protein NP493_400g00009 [Ridgeia piscesae]|uniref:DM2 domain-containing protein n=1 Tax=Ridgeia piscesae TaxID=27915 RepID=A0AAD9L1L6_RIDPI|nr:hypothetical protein NP493_400g00009 [Ridgeia piscesae]
MQQQRFAPPANPMARFQQTGYPGPPRPGGYGGGSPMPPQMGGRMGSHMTGGQMTSRMGAMPGHPYPASTASSTPSKSSSISSAKTAKAKEKDREKVAKDDSMHRGAMGGMHAMDHKRHPPFAGKGWVKEKKKKRMADKVLPQKVRDLVPESQAYMDLLAFERKLDSTIMRKRLDIQEALKRPMKQKKKLRIFISNTFFPAKHEPEDGEDAVASWELRVEGRFLDESHRSNDPNRMKRKFSSFFKSLVIELDKDLYGPDNHLVEWHRTATTQETDGFQVKRPGDQNVKCTVLLMLDHQPMQFKLDTRLARLLGIHTQTRPVIINALWQYVKTHKLQDPYEREFINCDKYLEQIFECSRMKFSEIPQRLHPLLMPSDPIIINHLIMVEGPDAKKTTCYDIDVEVDDLLKQQMNNFLLSTQSQQEMASLDNKIHETVETVNQLKTSRDFMLAFSRDPQTFINNWLMSQTNDLKTMTDVTGNPEEERHAEFFYQPFMQEAVCRYFYGKVGGALYSVFS